MLAVGSSIVSTLHIKGNVMIGYGRGGGGGGFGGLPYRSSHQQGQDGRGRGSGRGGRQQRKQSRPRSQNNNIISIAAELKIPPEHRRVIVGRGGTTLKWLKEVSGANIFVPHVQKNNRRGRSTQQEADADAVATTDPVGTSSQEQANQHPVRVNSSELSSILHAFEEISRLLSITSDIDADFIPCTVKMKTNDVTTPVDGKLFIQRDIATDTSRGRCLFSGKTRSDSTNELQAYTIETTAVDEENVSMIVDNILFVDSSLERCPWYYKETPLRNSKNNSTNNDDDNDGLARRIVFVFGSDRDNSNLFFDALKDEISAAEKNASTR